MRLSQPHGDAAEGEEAKLLTGAVMLLLPPTHPAQVASMRRGLDAIVRKAPATVDPGIVADQRRNDDFLGDQSSIQMQLMRQQDQELDELGSHVARIGEIGLTIHEELESQVRQTNARAGRGG